MAGPLRPPPGAGFFPPLEEKLIADEVGGQGRGGGIELSVLTADLRVAFAEGPDHAFAVRTQPEVRRRTSVPELSQKVGRVEAR